MKMKVKVKIEKTPFGYGVSNDRQKVWEFFLQAEKADVTTATGLGSLASSLLTATLGHQFRIADEHQQDIEFTLTTETFERT